MLFLSLPPVVSCHHHQPHSLIQPLLPHNCRRKLQEQAEKERADLLARFAAGGSDGGAGGVSEREQQLELALIAAQTEKSMLLLEASQAAARHQAEVSKLQDSHRRALASLKAQELHMFRELCDGFEGERRALDARVAELTKLLGDATNDLAALLDRNKTLERLLAEAIAWEPYPA